MSDFDPRAVLAGVADEHANGAYIDGGRRCAIYRHVEDWWVGISPRNGYGASVEGTWADWVVLARRILAVEEARLKAHEEGKP